MAPFEVGGRLTFGFPAANRQDGCLDPANLAAAVDQRSSTSECLSRTLSERDGGFYIEEVVLVFRTKSVRTTALVLFFIVLGPYMGLDGLIRAVGSGATICTQWVKWIHRARLLRIPADSVELYIGCTFVTAVTRACLSIPPISRCHSCEALSRFASDGLLLPAVAAFHIRRSPCCPERSGPGPP
ncbi:MAG: hypothetical protein ACE15E_15920 [Acidobacteriota bacterium]